MRITQFSLSHQGEDIAVDDDTTASDEPIDFSSKENISANGETPGKTHVAKMSQPIELHGAERIDGQKVSPTVELLKTERIDGG